MKENTDSALIEVLQYIGPWTVPKSTPTHAHFRLSPLQKHVRKVVGGFAKKSCVSSGVRKPGNTYASPTAMI